MSINIIRGQIFDTTLNVDMIISQFPQLLQITNLKAAYLRELFRNTLFENVDYDKVIASISQINKNINKESGIIKRAKKSETILSHNDVQVKEKNRKQWSLQQGLRFAQLDALASEYPYMVVRIMGTDAKEPDFTHAFLEGKIMNIHEAISPENLKRWGCRHAFMVLMEDARNTEYENYL